MTNPTPVAYSDDDLYELNKLYDRTKKEVFLAKTHQTFFGSLLCSLHFIWTNDRPTAATNGINLFWNPAFFKLLPPATRVTVLLHELWHVALLHMLGFKGRNPKRWNAACDIVINNMLDLMGYSFEGIPFKIWLNHDYDGWSAEQIYDDLMKKDQEEWEAFCKAFGIDPNDPQWNDILDPEEGMGDGSGSSENHTDAVGSGGGMSRSVMDVISNVVQAKQAADMVQENTPEAIKALLKQFLDPKIPWEQALYRFFDALIEEDYSWMKRDRRFPDIYLPDLDAVEGLNDLFYFLDVSGSITDAYVIRFNSEVKYIKTRFNPKKLTLIQFDTAIRKVDVFTDEDPFDELLIEGRGGTSLTCVHNYINQHKPDAAIIFSDLECAPMDPVETPLIWVVVNNPTTVPAQGTVINIRE